jgi:oligopeptide/dipeptide ABC transporter ATP-binding protein
VAAVAGVSLEILAGTTLGLVGESGSGKSTLARMVMRLERPTAGHVEIDGVDMTAISGRALDGERRRMQMIFQDPFSSLDPRHTIGEIVSEPLTIHTHLDPAHRQSRVRELLALVGLEGTPLDERPRRLSGGQRQRVAIARALAVNPSLLVCDEPVSGLDVSTQAQVLNLIRTLQAELGTTYLFISHDLSVVRHVSDRIAVMLSGRVVESGDAADVLERPLHPYTAALLDSVPTGRAGASLGVADAERPEHPDTPVDNVGCPFAPRCAFAMDICRTVDPEELTTPSGSTVRCHLHSLGPALDGRTIRLLDRRSAGGSEPGPGSTPVHLTTRRS